MIPLEIMDDDGKIREDIAALQANAVAISSKKVELDGEL